MSEEIKEIAKACSDALKKGGIAAIPSSAGELIASNFIESPGLDKLLDLAKNLEKDVILVTGHVEKLNYLLQDIPELAYDLIDHSEKPIIIFFDKPSFNISKKLLRADNMIPALVLRDETISRMCNLGLKAMAAILLTAEEKAKLSGILPELDYVVTLPTGASPKVAQPSVVGLKMNGEVKIIRK
jgi:L-threonylcarbamoyladenylate synthase